MVVDPAADVAGTLEGEGKFESAWALDPELITDPRSGEKTVVGPVSWWWIRNQEQVGCEPFGTLQVTGDRDRLPVSGTLCTTRESPQPRTALWLRFIER